MKKIIKHRSSPVPVEDKPDITILISKMQEQLVSLEKKVDTLISRPSQKPAEEKHFSKPFQRFDRPRHHDNRGDRDNSFRRDRDDRDGGFRERSFTRVTCSDCKKECEVPFKPSAGRPVYCKECFAKRKEDRGEHKDQIFIPERHSDKHKQRESRKPGKKKQPGFKRRK